MSRPSKGARLFQRGGRYYIRDGDRRIATGTRDSREAEARLARYIAEKGRPIGPSDPAQITVVDVLSRYGIEHAPHTADGGKRIGYAIAALLPILGPLPVASLTGEVCRRYGKARGVSPGTVRKELQTLQTAINHCVREGYLTSGRQVILPPAPPPRDRWLTRDEAARLLWAARRNPHTRHLARFILVALYTGTRSGAILSLRFMPHTQGGYVDTERGLMYRRAAGEAETKKRTPPIPVPRPLLAHLRRWERQGAEWVVEYRGPGIGAGRGGRVGSLKTVWRSVLAESGIEHCTKHDLRHTAVTWAMQAGVDKWAAAGFFGLTLNMIERVYGHHHPDHLRSAVEAMERKRA